MNLAMRNPIEGIKPSNDVKTFRKAVENNARMLNMFDGMKFAMAFLRVSLYNANETMREQNNFTMNNKQLREFYKELKVNMVDRMNAFIKDIQVNPQNASDDIDLVISYDERIMKKMGMSE